VTTGVTVSYEFPGNTYSAGKTDFWEYATKAFGLATTLPVDVGLKGKGLSGTLDRSGDHFEAVGIPLTEYSDDDTATRRPLQTALVTVRDSSTGALLTSATVVAPVSSEMACDMCHADDGDATTKYPITPTGDYQQNILAIHDYLSQSKYPAGHKGALLGKRPVMCAECHADVALGARGVAGVSSLSNAMHRHHNPTNAPDITPDNDGCYSCHPGADTQCRRCVMSQRYGIGCVDCHGDITQVAKNPSPWLNEPKCGNSKCHGASYLTDQPLYRNSKGHGGMYCAACHDSPHAIATSREASDSIKFVELQGTSGTLKACGACHATTPNGPFAHAATLPAPAKQQVYLSTPSSTGRARAYKAFTVSGVVVPKHAVGQKTVQLKVIRYTSKKWAGYGTYWAKNVTCSTCTKYTATLELKRGTYHLSAYAPADSGHASTKSPGFRKVVVR
jgi:hypothetical protein